MQGEFLWLGMFQGHLPHSHIPPTRKGGQAGAPSPACLNIPGAAWWRNLAQRAEGLGQVAFSWKELKDSSGWNLRALIGGGLDSSPEIPPPESEMEPVHVSIFSFLPPPHLLANGKPSPQPSADIRAGSP